MNVDSERNLPAKSSLEAELDKHRAFFRDMLGNADEPTAPYGLTRVQTAGSGICEWQQVIDRVLAERLSVIAETLRVDISSIFHLAWAIVLARTSGRNDVAFGTAQCPQTRKKPSLIGFEWKVLPLRIKVEAPTVTSAIKNVDQLLADRRRHELALRMLTQDVSDALGSGVSYSSLFSFRSQRLGDDLSLNLSSLFEHDTAQSPFALAIDDTGEHFLVTARVDAAIDAAAICSYMSTALSGLAGAVETNADAAVQTVSVLPPSEFERVTIEWNNTSAPHKVATLHALYEEQAWRTPLAMALTWRNQSLTYDELNVKAGMLGDNLAARKIGPGSVVAVCLPRSPSTVVALLAILKVGAVYLPLDPAYPRDRLAFMIADAGVSLLITNSDTSLLIPPAIQQIDVGSSEIAPRRSAITVSPSATAYIMYTSGSSGKPKGVAVSHSAVTNFAFAKLRYDPLAAGDRVLAAVSVSFDVSIEQLIVPLLHGATVIVADDVRSISAQQFWEFIDAQGVTQITSVPSFFESLLGVRPKASSLIRLMLGGEELSPALVDRLRQALPQTQIVNLYGPTEACIWATSFPVDCSEVPPVMRIGKPLDNCRAYVLDSLLNPVGIGVIGELYLAGAGLANGYINNAALTAERFVVDPFGAPGGRLYKTGDRARWHRDGNLEFLGRSDTQVKIRGHRVELGEIEAQLTHQVGVREAAVIVREDVPGQQQLIAYYTASEAIPPETLRSLLSTALPDYMVPATYIHLVSLPLTINGKLDRKTLSLPIEPADIEAALHAHPSVRKAAVVVRGSSVHGSVLIAYAELRQAGLSEDQLRVFLESRLPVHSLPAKLVIVDRLPDVAAREFDDYKGAVQLMRGIPTDAVGPTLPDVEDRLIRLWEAVLGVHPLSVHDDFFALGGHSLLAAGLIDSIDRIFNIRLTLDVLFYHPTVAQLAIAIRDDCASLTRSRLLKLNPRGTLAALFFLHGSVTGGYYCWALADHLGPDRPMFAVRPYGAEGGPILPTIEAIAAATIEELKIVQPEGPYLIGGFSNGGLVAFEMARQLAEQGNWVDNVLLLDVQHAGSWLRTVVDAIEKMCFWLRIDRTRTLKLCGLLSRCCHYFDRFASAPGAFLLRQIEKFGKKQTPSPAEAKARGILATLNRISDCYVPRPYSGRVAILFSEEAGGAKQARRWASEAVNAVTQAIPGDHLSCVTDHIAETAQKIATALDPQSPFVSRTDA